jgi:hypothetical protein
LSYPAGMISPDCASSHREVSKSTHECCDVGAFFSWWLDFLTWKKLFCVR